MDASGRERQSDAAAGVEGGPSNAPDDAGEPFTDAYSCGDCPEGVCWQSGHCGVRASVAVSRTLQAQWPSFFFSSPTLALLPGQRVFVGGFMENGTAFGGFLSEWNLQGDLVGAVEVSAPVRAVAANEGTQSLALAVGTSSVALWDVAASLETESATWQVQLPSEERVSDLAFAGDLLVVAGSTSKSDPAEERYLFVHAYEAASGTEAWTRRWTAQAGDLRGLAASSAGIWLAGSVPSPATAGAAQGYAIARWSLAGEEVWSAPFSASPASVGSDDGLSVDDAGRALSYEQEARRFTLWSPEGEREFERSVPGVWGVESFTLTEESDIYVDSFGVLARTTLAGEEYWSTSTGLTTSGGMGLLRGEEGDELVVVLGYQHDWEDHDWWFLAVGR